MPENGCAWLLWGRRKDHAHDQSSPLGCYATRETALAAEKLCESHENAHLWSAFWVTPWPLATEPTINFRMRIT